MSKKKVSIGIPVYNEGRFIRHTLNSALEQGAEQIIVSDNASTDATAHICQAFAAQNPSIHYHRYETTQPVMTNFMNCLHLAKHEYYMCMGGHDFLAKNYVRSLRRILDTGESVLAYSNAVHVNDFYVFQNFYEYTFAAELQAHDALQRFLSIISQLGNCTMYYGLFRKNALMAAQLQEKEEICGGLDHCVLSRIATLGTMTLCPDTTFYRLDPPQRRESAKRRWARVLRSVYADAYSPSTHPPELIPAGIIKSQLRAAYELVQNKENAKAYLTEVLRILITLWAINHTVVDMVVPTISPIIQQYNIDTAKIFSQN